MCPDKNLTWANGKVKALGVWFCVDHEESLKKNYEDKVRNVENVLNNWHNKRLTLIGKIAVVKALAASQLNGSCHDVYVFMFKILKRRKLHAVDS